MKQKSKDEISMNSANAIMNEIFENFVNKTYRFNDEIETDFARLNKECPRGQESDLLHLISSYKHLYKGELLQAILAVDAILVSKTLDPHSIFNARKALTSIHEEQLRIGKENIEDQRILPVAEALYIRGCLGLEAQELMAAHFDVMGQDEKAKKLRETISKLLPNYLTRKAC